MDLAFLQPLYREPGPYVSVYIDMRRTTEDAAKTSALRRRAIGADLARQGADLETIREIDRFLEESSFRAGGYAIFATDGGVTFAGRTSGAVPPDRGAVSPLPHVFPYLVNRGEAVPHLTAEVDRRGASIDSVSAKGDHRRFEVHGEAGYPERKINAGDLNQSRFQRAAEEVWRANAKQVARAVDRTARADGAEVVILAGDVRARTAVMDELGDELLHRTVETDSGDPIAEAERITGIAAAGAAGAPIERFHEHLGRNDRAVDGLRGVVRAFRRAQVESLLLVDHPESRARLWIGPEPTDVALDPEDLPGEPVEVRADDALVRAAAGTGADLVVAPRDGLRAEFDIGALLRYGT